MTAQPISPTHPILPILPALALLLSASTPLQAQPLPNRPWSDEVIYFVMTDRFHDGDPANNIPPGSDPALYDPEQKDLARYHGGDLRGLEKAIEAGYFNQMGVTALWLTPVVRNVWRSGYDLGGWKSGYHGYWTQDWLDIDPHLASRRSLDGKRTYPDSPEGRMSHYRDFVHLAHSKGLRIIQDVVLNHAGPVFFYDSNGNGLFDKQKKDEWILPFRRQGHHQNAVWGEVPEWNLHRTQPDGPRTLLGQAIATTGVLSRLDSYGRKGFSHDSLGKRDGEEIECDFFSLRDLWTAPDSTHFDELVNEFVEIHHFYLTTIGVDGLRVDTVKHVHHPFWDAFTSRLRQRLGNAASSKLLFGEIYDGDPAILGRYTWRSDWPQSNAPCLDSVLDFDFCFSARAWLRHEGETFGSPAALERALLRRNAADADGRPLYNPNPGPDGLNSRDKMITFLENHDGLNRFRCAGVSERRHRLAQALVMTSPGIPCLYYGAEFALQDEIGKIGQDCEHGRLSFFRKSGGPAFQQVLRHPAFSDLSRLAALRESLPALRRGEFIPLWIDSTDSDEDDGLFAFARAGQNGGDAALVLINASPRSAQTAAGPHTMRLPDRLAGPNARLETALVLPAENTRQVTIPSPLNAPLKITIPPESAVIFRIHN